CARDVGGTVALDYW
nr:immunoglobulin heavy chain junction region [Macaca mulatta]MOV39650.1 immunoglobulin heavy chain junction region [Macaca mulatta]MOV39669.1 immunoglobulin heavy chain junction region [Macaca mulatta]MOV40806.1 immunoglobulin heavy chain junction region [Macaca mulatta]MOV40989.1 immunoglobulin heavy chain junction region [Macaca mulatta]